MDYTTYSNHLDDPYAFNETFLYPVSHQTNFGELDEHGNMDWVSGREVQDLPELPIGEAYITAAPNASSPNAPLPVDGTEVGDVSMVQSTHTRKKKAKTLKAKDWEPHKSYIKQLSIDEGLPLGEVMDIMKQEFGFQPTERQYKHRLKQWNLGKNVKPQEIKAIVRKQQYRRVVESHRPELAFTVRGQEVPPQKIDRWMKRNGISQSLTYAPSPAKSTPSAVLCRTVSQYGSPYVSPASVGRTPTIIGEGVTITPYSPQALTPTMADLTTTHPTRVFTGQWPVPFHQPLPNLDQGVVSAREASRGGRSFLQQNVTADAPQTPDAWDPIIDPAKIRYRQWEEEHLRVDLKSSEILYGRDSPAMLGTLLKLGDVLLDQGRYSSAEKVIREAANAYSDSRNKDDIDMLNAWSLLGRLLRLQGSYSEAATMQKEVLEKRKRILGDEHPDTITAMSELAKMPNYHGAHEETVKMLYEVLEKRSRTLGHEHLDTITAKSDLALKIGDPYHHAKYDTAAPMQKEVLEKRKRILGDKHPDTITAMSNLAATLYNQRNLETSLEMRREVLAMRNSILGAEHPDTLSAISELALSLCSVDGEFETALGMARDVLAKRQRTLGDEHFDTIMAMSDVASMIEAKNDRYITLVGQRIRLGNQDELDAVMEMRREAFAKLKRIFGDEHYYTMQAMSNLANSLSHQDKFNEAETMQREVTETLKRTYGNEHPMTIKSMNNLAMALYDLEEFKTAEAIQREVLERGKRVFHVKDPTIVQFTRNLERILEGDTRRDLESDSEEDF